MEIPKKVFLISLATAAGLASGATQWADIGAANAKPVDHRAVVVVQIAEAQEATVENFLKNRLCDPIKAEFGIDEGDPCPVAAMWVHGVSIKKVPDEENPGETNIEFLNSIKYPGLWTPGDPE